MPNVRFDAVIGLAAAMILILPSPPVGAQPLNQFYMSDLVNEFNAYRAKMNEKILGEDQLVLKRLFNLDSQTYAPGALDAKTKEMLGLVASMVLRCDDCVRYHLQACHDLGLKKAEVFEVFSVATIVGGTIVIPHLRRAVEFWEALEAQPAQP